mmetsp:Transcript_36444/g.86554  ORF Transcript_36444/g.86554 Transcript_36444/m.86554 type:complete len:289 (+) Transcript_36444:134-1000(+)
MFQYVLVPRTWTRDHCLSKSTSKRGLCGRAGQFLLSDSRPQCRRFVCFVLRAAAVSAEVCREGGAEGPRLHRDRGRRGGGSLLPTRGRKAPDAGDRGRLIRRDRIRLPEASGGGCLLPPRARLPRVHVAPATAEAAQEDVRERDRGRADQGGSARPRPQEAPREDPRRDGAPSQRALRDVRRQRLRGRRRVRDADAGLPPLHKGPNQARGDRGRCLLRARRLAGRDAEDPQVQPRAKRRRVLGGRVAGGGRDGRGAPLVPPSGAPPRPQRPPSGAGAVHLSRRVLLHA